MTDFLEQVKLYLVQAQEGKAEISDAVVEEFKTACATLLKNAFSKQEPKAFTHRVSSAGRPFCQQHMEKNGAPRSQEPYNTTMKFLIGDLIEAAAVAIMKGAGISVQEQQTQLKYKINESVEINGSLDVVIGDKVYDIKSASPWSFTNKFAASQGFALIVKDDAFGYLPQAYMYSEGRGLPFGGWIAINKATGEWTVCSPPIADNMYRKQALDKAKTNVEELISGAPFRRCFGAEEETWYGKKTGNRVLGITCAYCAYKGPCWGGEVNYTTSPTSKSKNPQKKWYVGSVA